MLFGRWSSVATSQLDGEHRPCRNDDADAPTRLIMADNNKNNDNEGGERNSERRSERTERTARHGKHTVTFGTLRRLFFSVRPHSTSKGSTSELTSETTLSTLPYVVSQGQPAAPAVVGLHSSD